MQSTFFHKFILCRWIFFFKKGILKHDCKAKDEFKHKVSSNLCLSAFREQDPAQFPPLYIWRYLIPVVRAERQFNSIFSSSKAWKARFHFPQVKKLPFYESLSVLVVCVEDSYVCMDEKQLYKSAYAHAPLLSDYDDGIASNDGWRRRMRRQGKIQNCIWRNENRKVIIEIEFHEHRNALFQLHSHHWSAQKMIILLNHFICRRWWSLKQPWVKSSHWIWWTCSSSFLHSFSHNVPWNSCKKLFNFFFHYLSIATTLHMVVAKNKQYCTHADELSSRCCHDLWHHAWAVLNAQQMENVNYFNLL